MIAPWIDRPLSLVTWMDILRFSASGFFNIARGFAFFYGHLQELEKNKRPLSDEAQRIIENGLAATRSQCERIGLSTPLKAIDRILPDLSGGNVTLLRHALDEVMLRIRDEISDHFFLFVPRSNVKYYEGNQLFGPEVANAFPSTEYDISEAGKCLALNRSTACVFHTMRVLEYGLFSLAADLKLSIGRPSWNEIIERIESEINQRRKQKRRSGNWRNDEQFHSEAASQFMHFKNAWRNHTAHSGLKYTDAEAESIFRHVGDFMLHLSKHIKETAIP